MVAAIIHIFSLMYNREVSIGLGVRSRRAVGSLIGIGFLLMILALGFSFYEIVNRIERSSAARAP